MWWSADLVQWVTPTDGGAGAFLDQVGAWECRFGHETRVTLARWIEGGGCPTPSCVRWRKAEAALGAGWQHTWRGWAEPEPQDAPSTWASPLGGPFVTEAPRRRARWRCVYGHETEATFAYRTDPRHPGCREGGCARTVVTPEFLGEAEYGRLAASGSLAHMQEIFRGSVGDLAWMTYTGVGQPPAHVAAALPGDTGPYDGIAARPGGPRLLEIDARSATEKVEASCRRCGGTWEVAPRERFVRGQGCPTCSREAAGVARRRATFARPRGDLRAAGHRALDLPDELVDTWLGWVDPAAADAVDVDAQVWGTAVRVADDGIDMRVAGGWQHRALARPARGARLSVLTDDQQMAAWRCAIHDLAWVEDAWAVASRWATGEHPCPACTAERETGGQLRLEPSPAPAPAPYMVREPVWQARTPA